MPVKTGGFKTLGKMIDKLPAEASLYDDSAYTQYRLEEFFGMKMHLIKNSTKDKR